MDEVDKKDVEERHCSLCEYYWTGNSYMYCCFLKRRITARKKCCKNFKSFMRKRTIGEVLKAQKECGVGIVPTELVDYYYRIRQGLPLTESQEAYQQAIRYKARGEEIPQELLNTYFID